jgi:BolA protein
MIKAPLSENMEFAGATKGLHQPSCRHGVDAHLWGGARAGEMSMGVAEQLEARLRRELAPSVVDIADFSAAHAGHAGSRPGGESHFQVTVVAAAFAGRTRLERQRLVLAAAGDLMAETIHALTITALAPDEWAARRSVA